jgi:uncharacterized protein DUF6812
VALVTSPAKIKKKITPVVIYTAMHKIEGFYYSFENSERLLDDLNARNTEFIPLTDVKITKLETGDGLIVASFVAVNVHSITLFFPNPKAASAGGKEIRLGQSFTASETVPDLVIGTA